MGAIKSFYDNQKQSDFVEFVKPSCLPDFGVIHIHAICVESWCNQPVLYKKKKGETKTYKSIVNYQLGKIFQKIVDSSAIDIDTLETDDYGRFIVKEDKYGKKYNYFVLV